MIEPTEGTFLFVSDYQDFTIDTDVTIISIENAENFRHIHRQKHLFNFTKCLFVSRYPQNQSKDFFNWMQQNSNPYYHFGDFDFAGLNIFVNEYQKHLGSRARLFVPENLEQYFVLYGNRELFDKQQIEFDVEGKDEEVRYVCGLIERYRKGVEQEAWIDNSNGI